MASRKLEDLTPEMHKRAREFRARCAESGLDVLIYCTYRDEHEQARLFRVNRDYYAIEQKITSLNNRSFPELAEILRSVGPQPNEAGGRIKTKAGPGESYHQHRLAFDCVPVVSGKLLWDAGHSEWQLLHDCARKAGLERLSWELPHLQMPGVNINELMALKYRRAA